MLRDMSQDMLQMPETECTSQRIDVEFSDKGSKGESESILSTNRAKIMSMIGSQGR